ncbi:response regulator transcription factor [Pikeienuella piscinae]|nr:response regulator [Pikeienuella piscinae]
MARVMIVEDEPHIVESLTFLFSREGFEVTAHDDGEAAFAALDAAPPDVLVLDVMLPGLNGFELLRRVRAKPNLAALPVLVLTAKGQRRDRETAEASGADRFMTKPFSNAELIATVKALAG